MSITSQDIQQHIDALPKVITVLQNAVPEGEDPTKSMTHQIVFPAGITPPPPDSLCFTSPSPVLRCPWKFKIDPFQRIACSAVDRDEAVLVAAHTSAGKTVVAEHAIALALARNQRVVYTSPIKALSNQKFADLQATFGVEAVGLMTGDVTTRRDAPCVVMTTEILQSMLRRNDSIVNEIGVAIFDEVHYMRDEDRGVVWEETIASLPPQTNMIFLSATIPNSTEFAGWIATIHQRMCHVIYTTFRPVPLRHYVRTAQSKKPVLVLEHDGTWHSRRFAEATAGLSAAGTGGGARATVGLGRDMKVAKRGLDSETGMDMLVRTVAEVLSNQRTGSLAPTIIFSFSRAEVTKIAERLSKSFSQSLIPEEKQQEVDVLFTAGLDGALASEDDRLLPEIQMVKELVRRGIGIHHAGLLPVVKELVEQAFGCGLVQVLIATETFAMGVNMPANSVIFSDITKWDGTSRRPLLGSEYVQMAGRAGRRKGHLEADGTWVPLKDNRGVVIVLIHDALDPAQAQHVMSGGAGALNSSYRLAFHMLLSQLLVHRSPLKILRSSFLEHQRTERRGRLALEYREVEERAASLRAEGAGGSAAQWAQLRRRLAATRARAAELTMRPSVITDLLRRDSRMPDNTSSGLGRAIYVGPVGTNELPEEGPIAGASRPAPLTENTEEEVGLTCHADRNASPLGWVMCLDVDTDADADPETGKGYYARVLVPARVFTPTKDADIPEGADADTVDQTKIAFCDVQRFGGLETPPGGFSPDVRVDGAGVHAPYTTPLVVRVPFSSVWAVSGRRLKNPITTKTIANSDRVALVRKFLRMLTQTTKETPYENIEQWRIAPVGAMPPANISDALSAAVKSEEMAEIKSLNMMIGMLERTLAKHPMSALGEAERIAELLPVLPILRLEERLTTIADEIASDVEDVSLRTEFDARMAVLRQHGYLEAQLAETEIPTIKGRMASHISAANELVVAQLLFDSTLSQASHPLAAAILASVTADAPRKGKKDEIKYPKELVAAIAQVKTTVHAVASMSAEFGIPGSSPQQAAEAVNIDVAFVAMMWVEGKSLAQIMAAVKGSYGGDIVRQLKRLGELVLQVVEAANDLGITDLASTMESLHKKIERGIVGAASLYLISDN